MLASDTPEEIILAVLGNFPKGRAERIIELILHRLEQLKLNQSALGKYTKQLEVLSKLRNLNEIVLKKVNDMPITYNIENDYVYKQGKQEGKTEGKAEGKIEERNQAIKMMLHKNMIPQEIAEIFNVSVPYVQQIQKE